MKAQPYTPGELGLLRLANRKADARWFATVDMLLRVIEGALVPQPKDEDPTQGTESAKAPSLDCGTLPA